MHNGAWATSDANRMDHMAVGQDKIVRIFAELMRNMSRMKTYIRPSMCKPYGKQSESLQKSEYQAEQPVFFVLSAISDTEYYYPPPLCSPCSPHGHHTNRADAAELPTSTSYSCLLLEERKRGQRGRWSRCGRWRGCSPRT